MNKKDISIKDGKVVIDSADVLQEIKDQGMNFADDGSLVMDEGSNLKIVISVETQDLAKL